MGPGTATKHQQPLPPPPSSPTNSSSCESLNGLKFGQKIYFEDVGVSTPAKSSSSTSSAGQKKGRGSGSVNTAHPPRCQVEGCNGDLSDAKAYYSRHKVCGMHSKSPIVIVAGLQQRFCQQCSRFHQLAEFDQGKRSCRRRLAGHNERRRKPALSSLLASRYSRLSSPIFDSSGKSGSFLMEFASCPNLSLRNSLPIPRSSEPVPGNQTGTLSWQGYSETPSDLFPQHFHGPRHPPPLLGESFSAGVADSSCALSLLSNQTWGSSNTNTAPSLGLNTMWNFNGTPMTHVAASSNSAPIHQLSSTSWCFNGIDPDNYSTGDVPDLGRGQIAQLHESQLHGELDVPQPGTYETHQWSL